MRFGLQEILITPIIANVGKDFKDGGIDVLDFTFNTIRCDKKLVDVVILTNHKIAQFRL